MIDPNANTADLTDRELLQAILRRLDALEAKADDRARETKPLLNQLIKEMTGTRDALTERIGAVEKELRAINRRLDIFAADISKVRVELSDFDDRLGDLERRPN